MTKQTLGEELIEAMGEVVAYRKGEAKLTERVVKVAPKSVDVAAIRRRLGLSQREFANRYGFGIRALQEWEQNRRTPERSARILLKVIESHPEAVEQVLESA
ncbi:MAG TPA: type II toxin-antitoxin system MqsA family antitoxin [Chloroflexia bacterium]|nr:type II toxin-antitoxin system MqsA family antitoxin [Chloroflexia bacterium]